MTVKITGRTKFIPPDELESLGQVGYLPKHSPKLEDLGNVVENHKGKVKGKIIMFAIITKKIQKDFESSQNGIKPEHLPELCGYFGRACRCMDKPEGANRALCMGCPLAEYAENNQK